MYAGCNYKPGRVLGLYPMRGDSSAYYRLAVPLSTLESAGWAHFEDVTYDQLKAAETVVIARLGGTPDDVAAFMADLRQRYGVRRVLVDFDDAMFSYQPVVEVRPAPMALEGVRYALAHADGVIVQNAALRSYYEAYTDAPIHVLPNFVRLEDYPAQPPAAAWPPVVTLAGSPSHGADWLSVVPALRWLRQNAPDVRLRVLGCPLAEIKELATEYYEWSSPTVYMQRLEGTSIGLCPLPFTEFNACKSAIKAVEYALAAGAAVIGSPTQYAPLLAGGRGFVVPDGDVNGWARCIAWYLTNPDVRAAHAAALRAHVIATRDVRRYADQIASIYEGGTDHVASDGHGWAHPGGAEQRADHDREDHRDHARAADRGH